MLCGRCGNKVIDVELYCKSCGADMQIYSSSTERELQALEILKQREAEEAKEKQKEIDKPTALHDMPGFLSDKAIFKEQKTETTSQFQELKPEEDFAGGLSNFNTPVDEEKKSSPFFLDDSGAHDLGNIFEKPTSDTKKPDVSSAISTPSPGASALGDFSSFNTPTPASSPADISAITNDISPAAASTPSNRKEIPNDFLDIFDFTDDNQIKNDSPKEGSTEFKKKLEFEDEF